MISKLEETDSVGRIEGEKGNLYLCDLSDDPHVKDMYLDREDRNDDFVMLIGSIVFIGLIAVWVVFS